MNTPGSANETEHHVSSRLKEVFLEVLVLVVAVTLAFLTFAATA
jgi:hypothetical protein